MGWGEAKFVQNSFLQGVGDTYFHEDFSILF